MASSLVGTLAVTVPIGLALIGGIVKAAGLRDDVHRDWGTRAKELEAGVDEFAIHQLRHVYSRIGPWVFSDHGFWPDGPPPDPKGLSSFIAEYTRAIRFRSRLGSDIRYLMWVGPAGVAVLTAGLVATVAASLYGTDVVKVAFVPKLVAGLGIASFTGLLVCVGTYVVLRHRLTSVAVVAERGEPGA